VDDEFPEDPSAPVFFLSYARARQAIHPVAAPYEVNRHVMRLFTDLAAIVNELVPVGPGQDPGFMDMTLDGGERWKVQLLRAVGSCQVFISLLSASYFRSEWCAMEWDVFARRNAFRRSDKAPDETTGFLPVLWAPIAVGIPTVVNEVNRFTPTDLPDPSFAAQYHSSGILGLLSMGLENVYEAVVWKLAQQVQRMYYTRWVEPLLLTDVNGLQRSFTEGAR
jgi:hypothetical protein